MHDNTSAWAASVLHSSYSPTALSPSPPPTPATQQHRQTQSSLDPLDSAHSFDHQHDPSSQRDHVSDVQASSTTDASQAQCQDGAFVSDATCFSPADDCSFIPLDFQLHASFAENRRCSAPTPYIFTHVRPTPLHRHSIGTESPYYSPSRSLHPHNSTSKLDSSPFFPMSPNQPGTPTLTDNSSPASRSSSSISMQFDNSSPMAGRSQADNFGGYDFMFNNQHDPLPFSFPDAAAYRSGVVTFPYSAPLNGNLGEPFPHDSSKPRSTYERAAPKFLLNPPNMTFPAFSGFDTAGLYDPNSPSTRHPLQLFDTPKQASPSRSLFPVYESTSLAYKAEQQSPMSNLASGHLRNPFAPSQPVHEAAMPIPHSSISSSPDADLTRPFTPPRHTIESVVRSDQKRRRLSVQARPNSAPASPTKRSRKLESSPMSSSLSGDSESVVPRTFDPLPSHLGSKASLSQILGAPCTPGAHSLPLSPFVEPLAPETVEPSAETSTTPSVEPPAAATSTPSAAPSAAPSPTVRGDTSPVVDTQYPGGDVESIHRQPPDSDFDVDLDVAPRMQKIRFEEDHYTPKWVRKTGHAREGWCALCPGEGRWLQLKNSAYWCAKSFGVFEYLTYLPLRNRRYHRQYQHGISSVSGVSLVSRHIREATDG
ncbi:hypothetical protein P7C70_g5236, partial [Phenoliferia sp. Uapishka_3]